MLEDADIVEGAQLDAKAVLNRFRNFVPFVVTSFVTVMSQATSHTPAVADDLNVRHNNPHPTTPS